jgi:hypothetical protein
MVIRKENGTKPGRSKERMSSNSTEETGNHTEGTKRGPSQIAPSVGVRQENGKGMQSMNPMEPRGDEGNVVVFHVHQR